MRFKYKIINILKINQIYRRIYSKLYGIDVYVIMFYIYIGIRTI